MSQLRDAKILPYFDVVIYGYGRAKQTGAGYFSESL